MKTMSRQISGKKKLFIILTFLIIVWAIMGVFLLKQNNSRRTLASVAVESEAVDNEIK